MLKPVKFMHITKTGGSAIEDSARQKGVLWGRFDPLIINNQYQTQNIDHASIAYLSDNNLYNKLVSEYDWFVVVRNPYDRMISLVNWYRTYNMNSDMDNKIYNINFLKEMLSSCQDFTTLPANQYVFDRGNRIVKHVLRFENLQQEFTDLMREYNLDIPLLKDVNISHKYMTREDLTPELIALINDKYRDDFHHFNYDMLN